LFLLACIPALVQLVQLYLIMDTKSFLNAYVTERLPEVAPELFDGAPDQPHFTVDQRYIAPGDKPAMA